MCNWQPLQKDEFGGLKREKSEKLQLKNCKRETNKSTYYSVNLQIFE